MSKQRAVVTGWVVKRGYAADGTRECPDAGYIGENGFPCGLEPYVFRDKALAREARAGGLGFPYRRMFRVVRKENA